MNYQNIKLPPLSSPGQSPYQRYSPPQRSSNSHNQLLKLENNYDQFKYEIQMQNKAKSFICKIRKEKQMYYGQNMIKRKRQQQRKLQTLQIQECKHLQKLQNQKQTKRKEIQEKIRMFKLKSIKKAAKLQKQQNKDMPPEQKVKRPAILALKPTRTISLKKQRRIKTQPDQHNKDRTKKPSKKSPYLKFEDEVMIKQIKRKLVQLNKLSNLNNN